MRCSLYGVRSSGNWGHGDFSDLITLIDLAADLGASGIGLNPLHALFDDRAHEASPYFPNSRLFLNPLYIDVAAVPEFPGLKAAGLADAIERLRDNNIVDYHGVANAKTRGLKLAYKAFRAHGTTARREAFESFPTTAWLLTRPLWVLRGDAPEVCRSLVGMAGRMAKSG